MEHDPLYVLIYEGADGPIPCVVGTRQQCRDFAQTEPRRVFKLWAVFNDLAPVLIQTFRGEL
jgi:hypothetical protein